VSRRGSSDGLAVMRRGIATFLDGVRLCAGSKRIATAGVPALVARAWQDELLAGYRDDPARVLTPLRSRSTEDLIALRDIEFTSICAHHLLPFSGRVHLAYAPDGRITGLSRLGRLVDCLSRRLQIQEQLTRELADAIQLHLKPFGAACIIEACHACMTMRGARKFHSRTITAAFTGGFRRSVSARAEVIALLGLRDLGKATFPGPGHS
jgi:GTP cyclohydrolase I